MDAVAARVPTRLVLAAPTRHHRDQPAVLALRVLAVPELVDVVDDGDLLEVVGRRGRGRGPLEGPRVPRIDLLGARAAKRPHDVHDEDAD